MSEYNVEDIVGIRTQEGIACQECCPDNVWKTAVERDIIIQGDIEDPDKLFFCDKCGKQL